MKRVLLLVSVSMLWGGCAAFDIYRSVPGFRTWDSGGYHEFELSPGIHVVGYTYPCGDLCALEFNLLRCAEYTLEQGYSYFVVATFEPDPGRNSYDEPETPFQLPPRVGQSYTITMFQDRPEGDDAFWYQAEMVKTFVRSKYNLD